MASNLLIVESPAKAKTIEKILGDDYKVKSCFGHIRDLSKGDKAIDKENGYEPSYIVSDEKKKVVKELLKEIKGKEVWLATDEDREGEAISWHLCEVLGLDPKLTKRIVFHEITSKAIKKAVSNPRFVDLDVVNAQQARRVLDRLVGFELSPVLWRKISNSQALSAGRVQSVAVRIIVEREKEIIAFEPVPYYRLVAYFIVKDKDGNEVQMKAELADKFEQEGDAEKFLKDCGAANFNIANLETKPAKRKPRAPFITSTLQQEASVKLGFSVSRTMRSAQRLYEAGKITYMRTDSVNMSDTALEAAANVIKKNYGENYLNTQKYKTKTKDAQEAHEAIRPSYFENSDAGDMDGDEAKLYKLIWQRAIASQMSDAKLERTTATIDISTRDEKLIAKGEVLVFDGFLKVYKEAEKDGDSKILPPLTIGQDLQLDYMTATERFTRPLPRYTEASLVKKLEELGIGRPSTYAPTIATIQKRKYVISENRDGKPRDYNMYTLKAGSVNKEVKTETTGGGKRIYPTDMGILVNDFLVENFGDVLNYSFTAKIEEDFDKIAKGMIEWNKMIDTFYKPFKVEVEKALNEAERVTGEKALGKDPKTGKPIIARLGRFGPMVQIGSPDDEEKPRYAKLRTPFTLQNVTLEAALEMFKLPKELGEFEEKVVKSSEGRFGPYVMHDGKFASIPKDAEYTPLSITLDQAIELIKAKRESDAKKLIKVFEEHEEDLRIIIGRWGPYIKLGKQNIKIPKERKETAAEMTYEEVMKLVEAAPAPKTKGRAKAKPKAKAAAKKTATKAKAKPKAKTKAKK